MNEPIISPWIFYWIEVIDALKTPLWMMIVMSGAVRVFLQALLMDPDYEPQPREEKEYVGGQNDNNVSGTCASVKLFASVERNHV